MKAFLKILMVSAVAAAGLQAQADPVTLTVSPAVTSNTYTGVITLDITGLTNTEQVTVQRWMDGNANGVIDPGELMMDAFKIQDDGAMVIGGVTNLNVPFDSNSATGAITTTLNFAGNMIIENMVGHYVYTVTSPAGRFTPVTATFQVTNAPLSQSVSGVVYSNGVPQPYAVVVVQDLLAQNPAGSVQADAGGNYFLTLPPGNYGLIAAAANCYFDQSDAPSVILTNGASATNDLYLTGGGPNTISGNVYDAGSSNGIGGLLVTMQSGSLMEVAFTATNGNYSGAVTPAIWKIQPAKERMARRAYVLPEATFQVDASGGSVTNANIALPKGNALFYGRITDNANNPFANVEVEASTDNGSGESYAAKGYSDANGDYTVAVLGDLTNDWNCAVNNGAGTSISGYVLNSSPSTTNVPGQINLQNFVALAATDTITGHVQDNSGTNIVGVTLQANALIDGNNYSTLDGSTDNSGNYSLAVAPGQWNVQFEYGSDDSGDLTTQGYEDLTAPHIVNVAPTNVVLNITVYPLGTPLISSPQRISSTQFELAVSGATNVIYTVEVSTNLALGNWSTVTSFELTSNDFQVVDNNATNSPRFYRVQKN